MSDTTPEARAAARRNWQAQVYRLGEEPPGDDLSAVTTPEQRLEMVWELTAWMWELSGQPLPSYIPRRHAHSRDPSPVRDDWTDLLFALLDAEVRFLVVGAHAMSVHGVPQRTCGSRACGAVHRACRPDRQQAGRRAAQGPRGPRRPR